MCDKHFAQTRSYGSKHLDQKGGSLTVKNSSKYLVHFRKSVSTNFSMIYGMIWGTFNPPMLVKTMPKLALKAQSNLTKKKEA